jgi:hypothetical protein
MDGSALVVHAFDESARTPVLCPVIGGDCVPMLIGRLGEFLAGFEAPSLLIPPPDICAS